jgi:YD repeat-containing protein
MTDAGGNVWSYGYDFLGRQNSATDSDSGTRTTTYDLAGLVTSTPPVGRSVPVPVVGSRYLGRPGSGHGREGGGRVLPSGGPVAPTARPPSAAPAGVRTGYGRVSFDANGPQKNWRPRASPAHTMLGTGVAAERLVVTLR